MLIIGVRYFWLVCTYVSCNMQAMQAIPVSLHKIPVSLHVHSTPVSQMVHHVACS